MANKSAWFCRIVPKYGWTLEVQLPNEAFSFSSTFSSFIIHRCTFSSVSTEKRPERNFLMILVIILLFSIFAVFTIYTVWWQKAQWKSGCFYKKSIPKVQEKAKQREWFVSQSVLFFWAFRRKTSKRRGYTNFGQSNVTKTLPPPLQVRMGKSGNEQCKIRPELRGLPPAKVRRWKEIGK